MCELAKDINNWTLNEMGFRPQGKHIKSRLPSVSDYNLACQGKMSDIWKYVLKHVHTVNNVQNIKGNLALYSGKMKDCRKSTDRSGNFSAELADLIDRKNELTLKLNSTNENIEILEKDIDIISCEMISNKREYEKKSKELNNVKKKITFLSINSIKDKNICSQYVSIYNDMNYFFEYHMNYTAKASEEIKYYSEAGADKSQNRMDSHCVYSLKQLLIQLVDGYNDNLHENKSSSAFDVGYFKKILGNSVCELVKDHSSSDILNSLLQITNEALHQLKSSTDSINIVNDAENLKCQIQNGMMDSISAQPSTLTTVQQLLTQGQWKHLLRFFETEKSKNHIHKLSLRYSSLSDKIDSLSLKKHGNSDCFILAKSLYETEAKIAADKSAIKALQSVADAIKSKLIDGLREKETLKKKLAIIQISEKTTFEKQSCIKNMSARISQMSGRLLSKKSDIVEYVGCRFSDHESEISSKAQYLTGFIIKEVDLFNILDLFYVQLSNSVFTSPESFIVSSIKQFCDFHNNKPVIFIDKLKKFLEFESFRAPEFLLLQVMNLKMELMYITERISRQKHISDGFELNEFLHKSLSDHFAELCVKLEKQDNEQLTSMLPCLQKRLNLVKNNLDQIELLEKLKDYWWDQPAKVLVPWIKVESKTYQQWLKDWNNAVKNSQHNKSSSK